MARVAKSVDAADLRQLSPAGETWQVKPVKLGESSGNSVLTPSQALATTPGKV